MPPSSSAAASDAAHRAERAAAGRPGRLLVTVGLVSYGLVHLVVAWIALQLAFGQSGGEASQQGAMQQLAATAIGGVLLWVMVVGMLALVIWQGAAAVNGYSAEPRDKRLRHRLGSAGKAVVYAAIGVSALTTALGRSSGSGDTKEKALTATLMSAPAGRILVVAVGIVILALAGRTAWRGITTKFTKDLAGSAGRVTTTLGRVGYTAKGVALGIVGVLFALAGITHDPNKAGGLDQALKTLLGQPFGPVLLTIVALGIGCFGCYCFAWARQPKT